MVRFLLLISMLSLFFTISSCRVRDFGTEVASSEQRLCRYSSSGAHRPMQILRFTQDHGGRTCVQAGRTTLYIPTRDVNCKDFPQIKFINGDLISLEEGTSEFFSCSASTRISGSANVPSLFYVIDENAPSEIKHDFLLVALDIGALVTNDGLQVEHFGMFGRIICMETGTPEAVIAHMQAAGVVKLPYVATEVSEETCQAVSQRVQNLQWPINRANE